MEDEEENPCSFIEFHIGRTHEGYLTISQTDYATKLRLMAKDGTFSLCRCFRMEVAWLTHTSLDLLVGESQLSQFKTDRIDEDPGRFISNSKKVIKAAELHRIRISIPTLEIDTLHLIGISDAAFGNNYDHTSQLSYLMFLRDRRNTNIPIGYKNLIRLAGPHPAYGQPNVSLSAISSTLRLQPLRRSEPF